MSFSGIQGTIDLYTMQEALLTNRLTDIMTEITMATREISDIAEDTSAAKEYVKANYDPDSATYERLMDDIKDEYELELSKITAWESELTTQKQAYETEIQATSSYKESFKSMLKENVQKDLKYGGE